MPKATPTAKPSTPPKTMTGLAGWVEVFKAGAHTDSTGKQISFSQADLDQMVANHELGAAPAVIGHPSKTAPAYAWADGYKREGDSLFAKFTDINPAFEAGVRSGAYRNRSVSVYPDKQHGWRIRHVGWLGATPPAIDGLAPVEFAGDDAEALEFSAPGYSLVWAVESIAKLLRGQREALIAEKGVEAADLALPQWQIDSALAAASEARAQFQEAEGTSARLFSQPDNTGGSMSTFTQAQLDAAKEEARQEAATQARAEFAAKEGELILLKAQRQDERIKAQILGWVGEGKVLPAEQPGLAEFMASIEAASSEFTFSAHDGTEAKKTPTAFFADFMAARKPLVKLGLRTDPTDPAGTLDLTDARAIAAAASDFQAAEAKNGRVITVEAAVAHVSQPRS
jgi:hypothetical protein